MTLEGLKAKVSEYDEALSLLAGSTGQIFVNAKNGMAGSHTVKLDGSVGAMGEASRIDVAMVNEDSGLNGLADRMAIKKIQDQNRKENEKAVKKLKEDFNQQNPKGQDILKLRLWEEQDGICPYSGEKIERVRLLENGYA